MNISILGDGGWGTAMACHLCKKGFNVILWGPFPDNISYLKKNKTNPKFLKGVDLPKKLKFSSKLDETIAFGEILIIALPSQYVRKLLTELKPYYNKDKHCFVNLAKGIENDSLKRISELIEEIIDRDAFYTVLSGPSHAEEVAKSEPTAVVAASSDIKQAEFIQKKFMSGKFRIYCSNDVTGVELGGSLKNVYAIAAGISDGLGLGDNSKAALITRSIAEMSRLGTSLNGKFETFSGLSGIGDLIVTCCSKHSRNRFVGEKIGEGYTLKQITEQMGLVIAEGIKTTKSAYNLSANHNAETPIIDELYKILYEDKNPGESLDSLMNREAKSEIY
ncbi:MAG: NAD(P)-dependent glycerol-3-phosphate dehydrogenase [Victivallales bacterium]|nr:NAD(P)-dependent glycerol-3-phosphate dehydrogenase [Victivallales bacterium]MCF7888856.1 NAD(P)-dependent glycerol-3-phosphate dehydrogenase [Victivallales bacterium]